MSVSSFQIVLTGGGNRALSVVYKVAAINAKVNQLAPADGDDGEEGRERGPVQTRGLPASALVLVQGGDIQPPPRDYPVVGELDGKEQYQHDHVTGKERRQTSGTSLDLPKAGRLAANQGLTTAPRRRFSCRGARKARSLLAAIELVLILASSVARPKAKVQKKAAARNDDPDEGEDPVHQRNEQNLPVGRQRALRIASQVRHVDSERRLTEDGDVVGRQPSSAKAATVTQTDLKNSQRIFRAWISNRGNWNAQNAKYPISLLLVTPADAGKALGYNRTKTSHDTTAKYKKQNPIAALEMIEIGICLTPAQAQGNDASGLPHGAYLAAVGQLEPQKVDGSPKVLLSSGTTPTSSSD
ncbi:hypothetical protein DL767_002125 [Monosporascus sp. MG133]|nr:hypothetical protein DL767_002125 [Monosporascus sp. MG133]